MATKRIPHLSILTCLLLTACTIGIVQRKEVVGTPTTTIADTPTFDPAAQATIAALSTQNAVLATQAAANALSDTTAPTTPLTATPTPTAVPTRLPTKVPTPTPTPCTVALGAAFQSRVGADLKIASALGCPTTWQLQIWTAEQVFQHERMLWKEDRDVAYILFNDSGTYQVEGDLYVEGDPEDACPEIGGAPEGLFKPVRGFNRQWCYALGVRDRLGWALEPEAGYDATWQTFQHGIAIVNRGNHIFVMYDDGTWAYID
jgi:hypothetical protein